MVNSLGIPKRQQPRYIIFPPLYRVGEAKYSMPHGAFTLKVTKALIQSSTWAIYSKITSELLFVTPI